MEWVAADGCSAPQEALAGGVVRGVHRPGRAARRGTRAGAEIAENTAPMSVALAQRLLWTGWAPPIRWRPTAPTRARCSRAPLRRRAEGITSFLEKRPPRFPDRVSDGLPELFPGREEPRFA